MEEEADQSSLGSLAWLRERRKAEWQQAAGGGEGHTRRTELEDVNLLS